MNYKIIENLDDIVQQGDEYCCSCELCVGGNSHKKWYAVSGAGIRFKKFVESCLGVDEAFVSFRRPVIKSKKKIIG